MEIADNKRHRKNGCISRHGDMIRLMPVRRLLLLPNWQKQDAVNRGTHLLRSNPSHHLRANIVVNKTANNTPTGSFTISVNIKPADSEQKSFSFCGLRLSGPPQLYEPPSSTSMAVHIFWFSFLSGLVSRSCAPAHIAAVQYYSVTTHRTFFGDRHYLTGKLIGIIIKMHTEVINVVISDTTTTVLSIRENYPWASK